MNAAVHRPIDIVIVIFYLKFAAYKSTYLLTALSEKNIYGQRLIYLTPHGT